MKKAVRQQRACLVHWDICLLMLSACGSLERRLLEYLKLLSPWQQLQLEQLEALKLNANLRESLSEMARLCIDYLKVAKLQPPPWDKIFNVAKVRQQVFFCASLNPISIRPGRLFANSCQH